MSINEIIILVTSIWCGAVLINFIVLFLSDSMGGFNMWQLLYMILSPITVIYSISSIIGALYMETDTTKSLRRKTSDGISFTWNTSMDQQLFEALAESELSADEYVEMQNSNDKYYNTIMKYVDMGSVCVVNKGKLIIFYLNITNA